MPTIDTDKLETIGDVYGELRNQCATMVQLLDEQEWGLATWHEFVFRNGKRILRLLAEIGINADA